MVLRHAGENSVNDRRGGDAADRILPVRSWYLEESKKEKPVEVAGIGPTIYTPVAAFGGDSTKRYTLRLADAVELRGGIGYPPARLEIMVGACPGLRISGDREATSGE